MRTFEFLLGVLLLAIVLPLNHVWAGVPGPDADYTGFWMRSLDQAEQLPPEYTIWQGNMLRFRGLGGEWRRAWCRLVPGCTQTILVLTDDATAPVLGPVAKTSQVSFSWREGKNWSETAAVYDTRQHPLYEGIVDACRLAEILQGMNGMEHSRLVVAGSGYAASVALAVAALLRDGPQAVVAHCPLCPVLAVCSLERLVAPDGAFLPGTPTVARRMMAARFATAVHCPALVSSGVAASARELQVAALVYAALPGEKARWMGEVTATSLAADTTFRERLLCWARGAGP
jgi:hypothetical protein